MCDLNHYLKEICRLFEASLVNILPPLIQNILSSLISKLSSLLQVILSRTHCKYQI